MQFNQSQVVDLERWITAVEFLPRASRLFQIHQRAGQQQDNLCGPYWVSILLQAFGNTTLDPSYIAALAGSVLPIGDDPTLWVPPGGQSRQDYAVTLPTCALAESGTAVPGLRVATQQASSERYTLVPLVPSSIQWTAPHVDRVLALCQAHPDWEAVPLCNIRTGHFWGSRLPLAAAIAYLQGMPIQPPPADWNVGHFVTLAGVVRGDVHSLIVVRDTYPILGWDGYHLQPAGAIAAALNRDDGVQGGILLFVATIHQSSLEKTFKEQGFVIADWDNGTPWKNTSP
jgi:hypothetical protein